MSTTTTQIIVSTRDDGGYSISIPTNVYALREEALTKADALSGLKISNNKQQEQITAVSSELKGLAQAMEKTREIIKNPYYRCCQAIDAEAKKYKTPLEEMAKRLDDMVADWIKRERDRVRLELERLERERAQAAATARAEQAKAEAAQRAQAEAEQRRHQAELAAAEATTRAEKAKAKREQEAAAAAVQAAAATAWAAEIDASEAIEAASTVIVPNIVEPESTGGRMREKFEYEVTDIEALYAWDKERRDEAFEKTGRTLPTYLKIEVKKRDFDQFINMVDDQERASIPGITIKAVGKFHANITAPNLNIE